MRRPLSCALVLLCAGALSAEPGPSSSPGEPPKPRAWEDAACDQSGRGLLLRARGAEAGKALAEATAGDPGFETVETSDDGGSDEGSGEDGKPKAKKKKARRTTTRKSAGASVYRLEPGDGCAQRLSRLCGARGGAGAPGEEGSLADDFEVTAAPARMPKTAAELDKFFKGAGTLGKLAGMSFKTPADLTALFDKTRKLGSFEGARKLALESGGAFDAGPGGEAGAADAVLADLGAKADPTGSKYDKPDQLRKLGAAAAPPALVEPERDEAEPPRQYSRYAPVRALQRAYDWSAEIADNARFTYDRLRGNAPVEEIGPLTVVNGWARLPKSGPGFDFVGRGQFGTPTLVAGLMAAAADPLVNIGGARPMQVVAISKYGGGYFPPHITHRDGIDVDVALDGFRSGPLDAQALDRNLLFAVSVVERMKPTYILLDARRQYELQARAVALMRRPDVDISVKARIKAAYPLLFQATPPPRGKKLFSHVDNHYDHFHIRERAGEVGR